MARNEDDKDYLLDHYGTCVLVNLCLCNANHVWLGRKCRHWRTAGCKTWAELTAWQAVQAKLAATPPQETPDEA